MKIDYNKKVLIGVALVLYILYKMMGGWLKVLPTDVPLMNENLQTMSSLLADALDKGTSSSGKRIS